MAAKMKGIYKGFKYISHLFDGKERELQIGYPTDVKHVAHIGLDDPDGSTPSWMNGFRGGPDFSLSSVGGSMGGSKGGSIGGSCRDPTSTSQDFEASLGRAQTSNIFSSFPPTNLANAPKKQKRNKGKSPRNSNSSSPKSGSSRPSAVSRKSPLGKTGAKATDEA